MTNFEKIRQMTADEIAEFIYAHTDCKCCIEGSFMFCSADCKVGILGWLESEADEE